jgi:hypothetical protein
VTDMDQPADISPEDEMRVRAALRPLADVAMPPDVAERIDAVLRNEAADLARRAEAEGEGKAPRTQPSTEDSLRRRQRVMVGALASFVIIVIAGIVVSSHHTPAGTVSTSSGASALNSGTSITDSGRSWSPEDLQQTLRQTLTGAPSSQVPQSEPSTRRPEPASRSTTSNPGPLALPAADSDAERVQALISDPAVRQACINALQETGDAHPIAVDAGTFNGSPSVTFLFPSSAAANHVDIYVVGPQCSATEPNVLLFDRLPHP